MNNLTGLLGWIVIIFNLIPEMKIVGELLIVAGAILELKDAKK